MSLLWITVGQLQSLRGYSPDTAIVISSEQLDFGDVESQSDFVHPVLIRNRSSKEVQITGFKTSCDCTSVQPDKFVLAPRTERQVSFRMNLGVRPAIHAGKMEYPFQVHFAPMVDGQSSRQNWLLSGRVLRKLVANEPEVWLGSRSYESSGQLSRVVRVTSRMPLDLSLIHI